MAAFTTRKTSDGRWEYGTGEYDKTMAAYLGVNAPGPATTIPGKLFELLVPTSKMVSIASLKYNAVAGITIPVFYIWARGIDGTKRIAEWPFAKTMRDAAFASFVPAIEGKYVTDLQRVTLLKQLQASAGTPGLTTMATLAAAEKQWLIYDEIDQKVRHAAAEAAGKEAGGVVLVLLAAAALGLFIVLK